MNVELGQDQVVLEGTWYCIDAASATELHEFCQQLDIGVNVGIGLGAFHRLVCFDGLHRYLVDDTCLRNEDPLSWVPELPYPKGLRAELYPYQRVGSAYLRALSAVDIGCLVADEMGLGKTLQVISLLVDRRGPDPCLVVAPASLLVNWERELTTFAPDLKAHAHSGRWRAGVASRFEGYDVVLASYETVATDVALLQDVNWDVVIVDEAQAIKNPDTQRSKAIKGLPRRIGVAVTGTPVENRLMDLWSIAEFVVPQLLGSRESFQQITDDMDDAAALVGRIMSPVTLRRRVRDVAQDLPPLVQIPVALTFTAREASAYQALAALGHGLDVITRQRLYCAHADEQMTIEAFRDSTKVQQLLEQLEEVSLRREKALIFASFQLTLDRLAGELARRLSLTVEVIDGRTSPIQRQDLIDRFCEADGAAFLALNPRAAGVGLNIAAANHVFHFNPEWNPALTDQATARAYRRKQTRTVFVHHFYYQNSIEQRAVVAADDKRMLLEGVSRETE